MRPQFHVWLRAWMGTCTLCRVQGEVDQAREMDLSDYLKSLTTELAATERTTAATVGGHL